MGIDIILKILSLGMVASFITGIFSLIISIKNNKRIMQIEDKKERFQMDEKRYALLEEYLSEFEKLKFLHEKNGVTPEQTSKFLKDFFVDTMDVFEKIQKIHNRKSYLLDEASSLTSSIIHIDKLISEYIEKYQDTTNDDKSILDNMIVEMDKICIDIYELYNNYKAELRHNMEKILKRL